MRNNINDDLVSVIMPAYNSEKYIGEAIESVLNQRYKNWELIIVNDASCDNTESIIKEYAAKNSKIVLISLSENKGVSNARNIAVQNARGGFVAFLDSDDIWESIKLETQLEVIKSSGYDMVFSAYEMVDSNGKFIKFRSVKNSTMFKDLLKENSIIFSTTVFKKDAIKGISFNSFWFHEDYVFLLECIKKGSKFVSVDKSLVKYRVHDNGRSFNKFNAAKNRWNIYRRFLNLNIFQSIYYFCFYVLNGLRKYS